MNNSLLLGKSIALRLSKTYSTRPLKVVSHAQDMRSKGNLYHHLEVRHSLAAKKTSKYYEDKVLRFYLKYSDYSSIYLAYLLIRIIRRFFGATKKLSKLTLNHLIHIDVDYWDDVAKTYYNNVKSSNILQNVGYIINKEGSCRFKSGDGYLFAYTGSTFNTDSKHLLTLVVHDNKSICIFVYKYKKTYGKGSIILSSMYETNYESTYEDNLIRAKMDLSYLFDLQKSRFFIRRLPNEFDEGFSSIDNKGYYKALKLTNVNIHGSKDIGFKSKISKKISRG